jgi:3-oxosteroid 1-dehydrogenase
MTWDLEKDFVIVGSGAGSICAALVAKECGKDPLIVEKQAKVGGSTAFSGGVIWVPENEFLEEDDSFAKARLYLDSVIGDVGRASTPAIRDAYVRGAKQAIQFLERHGMKFEHARMPDYYSSAPGGMDEGRALIAPLFNINELGEWADYLGRFEGWPALPIKTSEFVDLTLVNRTWRGKKTAAKIAGRILMQKLTGQRIRGTGNAVQGRLLQIALREGVDIWREAPMVDFVSEAGRVTGIVVRRHGKDLRIAARDGVLLDAGGFSRNREMRKAYQPEPVGTDWTVANPGDNGEVIKLVEGLGGALDLMDAAIWVPTSYHPDGRFGGFHVPTDAGKPHCIIVDRAGKRIANEAQGYVDFGYAMHRNNAIPVWAIIESRHRKYYPWGTAVPGKTPQAWIDSGYIRRSRTLEDLAHQCGIDPVGLVETVQAFNGYAAAGKDRDFGRGESAYDRVSAGDPNYRPNPCLGKLEKPPFYAMQLWPGDVGTQGGIVVDEFARVLREDGSIIHNLYAAGNCTASMTGRCYPGGGVSVGKSLTFSYLAARHALGVNS